MTPRPIHRWKSLWLGILVLIFLAWAWAISIDRISTLHLGSALGSFILAQFNGTAGLFYYDQDPAWDLTVTDQPGATHPIYTEHWQFLYSTGRVVVLPHWLIILAFILTWSAFLLWRWRKAKHLTNPSHQPSPTP